MLLRWSCVLSICLIAYFKGLDCSTFGSSRSSSSGSSRNSQPSRFSSYNSRPSNVGSSYNSRPSNVGSSASHGSYGWTTRRTQRPYTQRTTTRRYYPVTTMPTHRSTTRRHIMTTMPTHRSTTRRYVMTTMPTHRTTRTTTRQPPYNPYYSTPSRYNSSSHSGITRQPAHNPFFSSTVRPVNNPFPNKHNSSHLGTTRQPAHNPFFSSTVRPVNNPFPNKHNSSHLSTTRQPAYNPFFSSTARPVNNPFQNKPNSSHLGTTKQPAYNPFFSSTARPVNKQNSSLVGSPIRNNGTNWYHSTPGTIFSTKATPRPGPFNTHNGTGAVTQRPFIAQTTKVVPVGNGNNSGRWNTSRPVTPSPNNNWKSTTSWNNHNTPPPRFTRPSWNNSSPHGSSGVGTHQNIYRPPGQHNSTFTSRPTYITGTHPHTSYPTHSTGTTIVNNNNYHYQPGGGYYHPPTGSVSHVTVINNNNYYNPNHRIIVPSTHYYGYGPPAVGVTIVNSDYYSHPISSHYVSTYHYSPVDTGSSTLGFYLGYQLGRISRPSYYYHSTSYINNEYVPRYDHYTVHHYYHDSTSVPRESPIQPNAIVLCPGDTGTLCPSGNMPLCTNNGAVMCVVNAQSTVPCTDNTQINCARSTISCNGNNSPECRQQSQASISIPCVSTAKIDAGVDFVNNSLIVTNPNDSSTKSFCVTIVALPSQSQNATKSNPIALPLQKEYSLPFRYTTNDTGVSLLGYYLGSKLQSLTQPSYSFLNYDNNYNVIEKFDHYNVYHYDHDATVLPKLVEIKSDQIMSCAGDSGTFCPQNTTSLCLFDGAVICVAEFNSTVLDQQLQINYIYSNISCINLKSPACTSAPNDSISIQIPCISTARLYAKSSYLIKNYGIGDNTIYYKTLEPFISGTSVEPLIIPRELCVAVLALPGEKVVLNAPKPRKVTGIPNALNSLNLPNYTYDTKETGNNIIGHYLHNKLSKLSFPTYYWINAYLYHSSGEIQKYDHYSVHYYEHGKEIIPSDLELQAADMGGCDGDSGLICPQKTNSLCLNDGSVWCVTDLLLTNTCSKYNNSACVKTEISCENNKSPHCNNLKVKKVALGCVATLTISGDIMAVSNTIYKINPNAAQSYSDIKLIPGTNNNTGKAQHFCVALVNIPIERKITVGEQLFENSDSIFGVVASKIFGN